MEDWLDIPSFPRYAVSNQGRVLNVETGRIMAMLLNQRGVVNVGLTRNRIQYKRAVNRLVAESFLYSPSDPTFDTPINLDGDRLNNSAMNLMWRPRWFAVEYNQQFDCPPDDQYVMEADTGEYFMSTRDAAVRFGLIDYTIFLAAWDDARVWPTNQKFLLI